MAKKTNSQTKYTITIGNEKKEILLDKDLQDAVDQAGKDYTTSKNYIDSYERDIWRAAYKAYHMSTFDRKAALKDQHWKTNVSIGIVRSFVDVLKASVKEKPITFYGVGMNNAGIKNKENVLNTLKYISDVTGFHTQLKKTLGDGLNTGTIALRIGYKKTGTTEKIISIINGTNVEETIETQEFNTPYAVNVSVFKIFPDPYTGPLRYVTERDVVSYGSFIEVFGHLIRSKQNKSPFKDIIEYISVNKHGSVDFTDYGNIVNQVHQKRNEEYRKQDAFINTYKNYSNNNSLTNYDEDKTLTEGLVEFRLTSYEGRMVLIANGYPVYIGDNIYGFINYVVKAATDTDMRFGEGIPYLIKPLEDVGNSFINNYFDGARSIAQPTFVVNKNLMINDDQLQDGTPGGLVYVEANDGGTAVQRLDKGGLNDFGVLEIIQQIAQQITGISEYNLGVSAGERTASGALAVTQSSQKRMSPYISNFLDAVSMVAYMWLKLCKKFWTKEQFIFILDENGMQIAQAIKNKDLLGNIAISLQAEGIFGAVNEMELQKLITMYNTLAPSGFTYAPEIAKEIFKKSGFEPSRFIVEGSEQTTKPDNYNEIPEMTTPLENPEASLGEIIQQGVNPQINAGNKGEGQQ